MDGLYDEIYYQLVSFLKDNKISLNELLKIPLIRNPSTTNVWYKFCLVIFQKFDYKHEQRVSHTCCLESIPPLLETHNLEFKWYNGLFSKPI